jgi:recombination associated protein RdgC
MLFRNLFLFRFPVTLRDTLEQLEAHLPMAALKPIGPLETATRGFVSPFGRGESALSHQVGHAVLLTLGGEDKILPAAVVNEALATKIEGIREREGRTPGGREGRRLKDEVLTDLLPRAFARPTRVNAYLDLDQGWLVVDTASRKVAESVVTAIRDALGSFPALPVNAETSPRAKLTAWVSGEPLPEGWALGDEIELRDPVTSGAVVKYRRQELDSDEVREHLKVGKQGFQLALTHEDRLSFVLGEDMVVRKLKFLETATEPLTQDSYESARAELDAVFALMSGELKQLLQRLTAEFELSSADA